MTREHLLPKFLYEAEKEIKYNQYYLRANNFVDTEMKIKDVCGDCNNVKLSELDGYVSILYKQYFQSIVKNDIQINFKYDFDMLARWLLKMGYNSARANNADCSGVDQTLKEYIIKGENRPPNVSILLALVTPYKYSEEELAKIKDADIKESGELPPTYKRVISMPEIPGVKFSKGIALNSYYFFVFYGNPDVNTTKWNEMLLNVSAAVGFASILSANKSEETIKASRLNIMDVLKNQLEKTKLIYKNK